MSEFYWAHMNHVYAELIKRGKFAWQLLWTGQPDCPYEHTTRLGVCSGWKPEQRPRQGYWGYATDDIFYLESCLFNQICTNGHEVWHVEKGDNFYCQFSEARVRELQQLLLTPAEGDPYKCW